MKVLGVIPARGGSKRVPRKNLRQVGGKPLIAWTIAAADRAELLTTWVVSTEDYEIGQVATSLGAYVIRRPDEYATDDATTGSVLLHALEWMEPTTYDMVVCLHPTSPIRDPRHIDEAIKKLSLQPKEGWDYLASVCELPHKPFPNMGTIDVSSLTPLCESDPFEDGYWNPIRAPIYIMNSSIYIIKARELRKSKSHAPKDGYATAYIMDRRHSLDINEEIDLKIAELFLQER